ncbi:MAG: hypothetical protein C0183_16355 [Roseiflexus castenholzii]|uniref:hypothetical protein n=1 Tax=Roseiflexus castenholzii TaxID=120962 RepID=UPI000CB69BF8|nr:MAG: hypothetical protein C0183_16355 [Roseiflexus castenholzii]
MVPAQHARRLHRVILALVAALVASIALIGRHPIGAFAQTASSNPPSLTIAGTLGDPPQERILFISAATPISGAEVLVSDFVRVDNAATITDPIAIAPLPARVEAGRPLTLTVTVSFANARSGAYNGAIWLNYDADGIPSSLQIPVTITIKDPPGPPFVALISGVAVAALISTYLGGGRQRDDLAVRIERLAARVTSASGLPDSVRRALRQYLNRADAWVRMGKLAEAQQEYNEAEKLLTRWLGWLESWRALQAQIDQARTMLQPDAQGRPAYAAGIRRLLDEIEGSTPTVEDLNEVQNRLNEVIERINGFLHLVTRHKNLQKILDATALTPAEKGPYQAQIDHLGRQIDVLLPDDQIAYQEIDAAMTSLNSDLKTLLPKGAPESTLLGGRSGAAAGPTAVIEEIARQIPPLAMRFPKPARDAAQQIAAVRFPANLPWARIRLSGFRLAQFLILITLWGWTGYNELYIQNPTFGSDWLSNYFTLLAWGFTSEAARATLTTLSGRLGLSAEQ